VCTRHSPLDHLADKAGQIDKEDSELLNQRLLSTRRVCARRAPDEMVRQI
jgi:hypothetical protein